MQAQAFEGTEANENLPEYSRGVVNLGRGSVGAARHRRHRGECDDGAEPVDDHWWDILPGGGGAAGVRQPEEVIDDEYAKIMHPQI